MANLLFWVPVVLTVYLPVAFLTTYGIAVKYGHVKKTFPYISDTGTIPPESCIFGQFLNLYSLLAFIFMIIRYLQVKEYILSMYGFGSSMTITSRNRKLLVNKISLVIGLLADFGASMVGNFQEDNVLVVHAIGAFMAFGLGGVYAWMQSVLSYYMSGIYGSSKVARHIRILCCFLATVAFILMNIFTVLSMQKFKGDIKYWSPNEPGYDEHLIATISEWLLAFLLSIFFSTFIIEFRQIGFNGSVVWINVAVTDEERLLQA